MASLSIKNLIQRLQNVYLPELLSLHGDCQWLISKVSCGEKKELQSNEARLVQFVAIVEGIIKQIRSYSTTINYDPSTEYSLVDLETKISKAVLPVKAKLIERVQQQLQQQQTQTSIPFQQTVQSNKKQLQPTRQNSSTLNTKQPSTSRNQSQTHIQKKEVPKATNNQTAKVSDDDVKRRASDSLSDSTTSTDRDSFSPRNTGSAISNRVGNHPQTKDLNNKAVTASSVQQAQKSFVTSAAVKAKLSAGKRGTTTLSADDLIFSNNNNNCSDIEAILASNISNLAKPPTTRPLNLLPISMLKPKLASVNGAVSIQQDSLAAKSPRASSINESNYPTEVVRQINRSSELVVRQISGDATQCITGTNIANTDNADNLKAANGAPKLPPPKKCSPLTAALLGAHLKPSKSVQSMPTVTLPTTVLLVDEMDRYLTPNELTDSTTQLSTAINKGCDVGTLFNQWITSNDENQPLCTTKIDGLIDVNVASSPWLDFGQSPLSRSRSNSNLNEDFDIGLGIGSDDHLVDGLAVHNFNNAMDDDHKLFTMDAFVDNNMDGMSGHTDTSSDSKSSCNASNSGNNDFYTSKNLTFSVSNSTMEEETNIIVAALTKRPSFNQNIFDDGCGGEFDVDHFIRNGDHTNPNTGDTNDINNILNDSANVSEMFPFNLASGAKVIQDEGLSDPSILLEYGNVMDNPQTSLESLQVEGKKRLYSDTLHKESVHNMDALVNMAESQLQDSAASKSVGSSIFDSMRKQFCIKSEIYNVLQPLSVSITHNNSNSGFAPSPKLTLKKSLSIIGSIKPLSTTDGDVQYYKSAMDIDLSSAVGMDGSIKESYCDEYMTSRRRRRLNQIVPNPRKPRQADYTCSLCSEGYRCNVNDNPWWAVYMHECPRCKQIQIPRIDINASSNAIELDPNNIALYGEGIEDSGDDVEGEDCYTDDEESNDCGGGVNDDQMDSIRNNNSEVAHNGGKEFNNDTNSGDGVVSGAVDGGEEEEEEKPFDGEGTLQKEEASKLLVLMCHARTCTGSHASAKHADICKSTKFLMLHIRDCKGVDIHGRDCQLPWCQPCKRMLKHLTQCFSPDSCTVCNPWRLPDSYEQLRTLNKLKLCQPVV